MASKQQTRLIKKWEDNGYFVINLIKTNKNGISDLIACKAGESPIFIESKEVNDHLSALQIYRLGDLVSQGFEVYVNDTNFKTLMQ